MDRLSPLKSTPGKFVMLGIGVVTAIFAFIDMWGVSASPFSFPESAGDWRATAGVSRVIKQGHAPPGLPPYIWRDPSIDVFVTRAENKKGKVRISSPPFRAGRHAGICAIGFSSSGPDGVFYEREDTRDRIRAIRLADGNEWSRQVIRLPGSWENEMVRLVAEGHLDQTAPFFGITAPMSVSAIGYWQHALLPRVLPLVMGLVVVLVMLTYFLLGAYAARGLSEWVGWPDSAVPLLTFAVVAAAGHVFFWVYFAAPLLGKTLSLAALLWCAMAVIHPKHRARFASMFRQPDTTTQITALVLSAVCALMIFYAFRPEPFDGRWVHHGIFRLGLSGDNIIPGLFAERMYTGEDLTGNLLGDWLSSDRGPLQTGTLLITFPFWEYLAKWSPVPHLLQLYIQCAGTILQCAWIPALWLLFQQFQLARQYALAAIAAFVPSGLYFVNTAFVWPKLFSAALIIGAFVLLFQPSAESPGRRVRRRALTASALACMGFLGHGSTAFTLLGMALLLLSPRRFPGWKPVAGALAVFVAVYAPWTAYQKYYNPPGNRLVKYHLANVQGIDERSALKTLADVYSSMTAASFTHLKMRQARSVLGVEATLPAEPLTETRDHWRRYQFLCLLPSLDILNLGWFVLIVGWCRPSIRHRPEFRVGNRLLAVAAVCVSLWFLLLQSHAVNIHNSYATIMVLQAGLVFLLSALPLRVFLAVFSIHALHGALFWWFPPETVSLVFRHVTHPASLGYRMHAEMVIAAVAAYAGVLVVFGDNWLQSNRPGTPSSNSQP